MTPTQPDVNKSAGNPRPVKPPGYFPAFDIDMRKANLVESSKSFADQLEVGHASENRLLELVRNKTIECKCDLKAEGSRRVYVELEQRSQYREWHPSGLSKSTADVWNFEVAPGVCITLPTENLRRLVPLAKAAGLHVTGGDNKFTRGVAIPMDWLLRTAGWSESKKVSVVKPE